jgi:hypothetical protein
MPYPYFTPGVNNQGTFDNTSSNAVRDTSIQSTEGRLVVDMADAIFVLNA